MTGDQVPWTEHLVSWVWEPTEFLKTIPAVLGPGFRIRGLANSDLYVRPGAFRVETRGFYRRTFANWDHIEYHWPAVVIDTILPFGSTGVLFDMQGGLARCATPGHGGRLRDVLTRAGFALVEVRRWGYEAPRPVPRSELGVHAGSVPSSVVADDDAGGPSNVDVAL